MFGKLIKGVVGLALTPVTAAADVVTLGGTLSGEDETYTGRILKASIDNIVEAVEED